MPGSRAPWWLFVLAVSFLAFFVFATYSRFWEPEPEGFELRTGGGPMVLLIVIPNSPADKAGLKARDTVFSVNDQPVRSFADWVPFRANLELNRPLQIVVERNGRKLQTVVTLTRRVWTYLTLAGRVRLLGWTGAQLLTLILAFVIAFSRPSDPVALLGAWLLATGAVFDLVAPRGRIATWRELPIPIGILLWMPYLSYTVLSGPIACSFSANFPRRLFRRSWAWLLIWSLPLLFAPQYLLTLYRTIYFPGHINTFPVWTVRIFNWLDAVGFVAAVAILVVNYRVLKDINERRRLGVLVFGLAAAAVSIVPFLVATAEKGFASSFLQSLPVHIVSLIIFLAFPLSFAHAILRHRLFDIRLMIRQGLQYALARGIVLSVLPGIALILTIDLFVHSTQPLIVILSVRSWIYILLAGLGLLVYFRRRPWLEALDRHFFREHYDAQRLLREVVEEVRGEASLERVAPRVVARIEAAQHPEFVALLMSEQRERFYRALAVAPAGKGPPPLQKESKLLSLIRLLGKPFEVPQTESGWLQQQLPHEETQFLRQGRIDLIIPVATDPKCTEVLLVLGVKRSEEPYSSEDQDLLVAIAASLAILLERPTGATPPRTDIFEECPQCGSCYDSGSSHCSQENARLVPVILPRLLEGRYHLERRLGRGGMGTVYAASDASLERRVAVKVIREDLLGSAEAAERFRREARTAANFAHPNVVTVFDFGVASGARAFLVMEILEGVTLRERLQVKNRLPTTQLLCISRDVCAALNAAHRRQLVHRDLKPENIFLASTESGEVAKVLDFGVAKFLSNCTEERTVDTAAGAVLGTPRYMSPEQRAGQAPHQAWDLWAFAVITYEMLTGSYPFESSCHNRLAAEPVFPFIPVAKHMPQASQKWQALFDHSFARELSDRHDSAEAFLSELQCAAT